MNCKTCGGNIYVDKVTVQGTRFELACLHCGRRRDADAKTNTFAKSLYRGMNLIDFAGADVDVRTMFLRKMEDIRNRNAHIRAQRVV